MCTLALGCEVVAPESLALAEDDPIQQALSPRSTSDYAGGCFHATERPGGTPLSAMVADVGSNGVLVVEESCTVEGELELPERFTLRGKGWAGNGILELEPDAMITFEGNEQGTAHTTLENLQIQGSGSGVGILLVARHHVHLRDLIVREFDVAVQGDNAYSIDIDHCNFNQNGTSLALGYQTNTWRIWGGICSQSTICMDIHPQGDGNDVLVHGVRMESNETAVRVGGQSTSIAFNRFEGNAEDVVRLPGSSGTALLANHMDTGTFSDLSQLNSLGLTELPEIDQSLRLGFVEGANSSAQLFTGYVAGLNAIRTQLLSNQLTSDGVDTEAGYHPNYGGWIMQLDGGVDGASSAVRLSYRAPGGGAPIEVFRVGADGTVSAVEYQSLSDASVKQDIRPVASALTRLTALRGVRFDWRTGPATGTEGMGLLADDVETVFPTAVRAETSGVKTVRYDQLMAPVVESIKELAARSRKLERENSKLRRALRRTEQRMEELPNPEQLPDPYAP